MLLTLNLALYILISRNILIQSLFKKNSFRKVVIHIHNGVLLRYYKERI